MLTASMTGTAPVGIGSILRRPLMSRDPRPMATALGAAGRCGAGPSALRRASAAGPSAFPAASSSRIGVADQRASAAALPRWKPASGRERAIRRATTVLRMTAATTMTPVRVRKKCPGAPASTSPTWIMPKVMAPRIVPIDAAVAAGEQRAADHRHRDRLQLDALAAQRVDRGEARHLDDAGDRGERGGDHEEDRSSPGRRARRDCAPPARSGRAPGPSCRSGSAPAERCRARRSRRTRPSTCESRRAAAPTSRR